MHRSRLVIATIAATATVLAVTAAVAVDPAPDERPRIAFVANGRNPADALAVGPTAGMLGAPVFTTNVDALPPATAQGLKDYDPDLVIVLGGTAAITDAVVAAISQATGLSITPAENPSDGITRVGREDRFGTAAAIADLLAAYDPAFALASQACAVGKVVTGIASDGRPTCATDRIDGGDAETLDGLDSTDLQAITVVDITGDSMPIDGTCPTYQSVTITVPTAGVVQVRADVNLYVAHANGSTSYGDIFIADAAGTCVAAAETGVPFYNRIQIPDLWPTGAHTTTLPASRSFSVTAGTHTFHVTGTGNSKVQFWYSRLEATFHPGAVIAPTG